jgi:thiamine-phosphate pyrophosphorylase
LIRATLSDRFLKAMSTREQLRSSRLYVLVTAAIARRPAEEVTRLVLAGGADIIQLREKELSDRDYLELARRVCTAVHAAGKLFIVNDRVVIARLVGADGVHLGQDDLPAPEARKIVGAEMLIGVSTHGISQARQAVADGADYLGVGPIYPTATRGYEKGLGVEYIKEVVAEGIAVPFFAIGAIDLRNLDEVLAAGARGVAVSSAICRARDITAVTADFQRRLHGPR